MSTADLVLATRELFIRSVEDEVYMATPFVDSLKKRELITYSGGTDIQRLVNTDSIDDLVQEYTANSALQDQKKTTLAKPKFTWKLAQLPLRYDVDEYLQNISAGKEIKLLDLANFLVEQGQDGMRRWLGKSIFNKGSTVTAGSDSADSFQSLVDALDHGTGGTATTYGTLAREFGAGTRDWWQGGDPAGLGSVVTGSSQDTAYNLTISNLRKWITESDVTHHMKVPQDLEVLMSPTLYNKLRAEMEAKVQYTPADPQSQGFNRMILDGHTITSVPYLQTSTEMKAWVFILNVPTWELRLHTKRNFEMTPFDHQAKYSNGHDYWLARIMVAGNFICWKPNGNMWLSNVS